jgi:CubicO group peptidase (beta-lactamase class C family)
MTTRIAAVVAMAVMLGAGLASQTAGPKDAGARVDGVFASWTRETPGCAVGVATGGTPVLAKGYGMADLEHDVAVTPDTIFEAGSVSKQFTAAAVLLLASEGKLSLDDPVRKYVPELPDYGTPLTIRHMLNHTSGLRDWGSVEGIAGWPRTSRVYTHAHVLEIVSRQTALNFTPGTRWSYSNTGFNLAAIIVARVSGTPFPEFTRTRLFQPLGMTHTSWRDDYTQIVKGRAQAYSQRDGAYHTDMPFEDVYGNGGLLTTVGDLLKWNEHFDAPKGAHVKLVVEEQRPGTFTDGRPHGYGLGLFVGRYKGLREVYHSGSTAGYSAFLTRFPDRHVSVAVLCNATTARATEYAHAVADAYLGDLGDPLSPPPFVKTTATDADFVRVAGLYRNTTTGVAVRFVREGSSLRMEHGPLFDPMATRSGLQFMSADLKASFDKNGMTMTDEFGTVDRLERVAPASYTDAQLASLEGAYHSDDAETTLKAVVENHALVLKRRPDTTIKLTPTYADAFTADHGLGTVIFTRGADGRVTGLRVVQDRVWDLPFVAVR